MESLFALQRIWVLDNDFKTNDDVMSRYFSLLDSGERVFIWPKAFAKYKDVNEICMDRKLNSMKTQIFEDMSFTGDTGKRIIELSIKGEY